MAQIGVNKGEYTFDASLKTITFTGVTVDTVDQVKLVNNVTDGIIIFNPIDPTKLGVLAANVLTLTHDTTGMSDTDDLFICINFLEADLATEATLSALEGKDFATETTLSNVDTSLTNLDAKDFATETTQILNKDLLTLLEGKDFSSESTLSSVNLNTTRTENLLSELIQEQQKTNKILRKIGNDE